MKKLIFPLILLSLFIFANCSTENAPIYSLSTNVNPSEAGTISPASGEFDEGTEVEIVANQNEHWVFQEWQGDFSGSQNSISVTMDSDKHITAMFVKREYPLTIEIDGEGTVQERIMQQKTTDYPHGTIVELEAIPVDGWRFKEWQGDLSGDENPSTITVENETSVKAIFERRIFSLNIEIEGNGSISEELVSGSEIDNSYEFESEVNLTANPSKGWRFKEWQGDLSGDENPSTITFDENKNIIAEFEEFPDSPFAGGDGSEIHPFEIETLVQLQEIRNYPDQHFIQISDIDASETATWNSDQGFNPIGDDIVPFTGAYNGDEHIISGLTINRRGEDYVGLFGYTHNSIIENVQLVNISVEGNRAGGLVGFNRGEIRDSYVEGTVIGIIAGGLVGSNFGPVRNSKSKCDVSGNSQVGGLIGSNSSAEISNSSAIGDVSGEYNIGGLVGSNRSRGTIKHSFAKGDVSGEESVGGLVGDNFNSAQISNSYAHGKVVGEIEVGGLVGLNRDNGEISLSYAIGNTTGSEDIGGLIGLNGANVESSYWDKDSTGQSNGIGRGNSGDTTGLITSELTGSAAKENMPEFDWVNIWLTTSGYPILRWQEN